MGHSQSLIVTILGLAWLWGVACGTTATPPDAGPQPGDRTVSSDAPGDDVGPGDAGTRDSATGDTAGGDSGDDAAVPGGLPFGDPCTQDSQCDSNVCFVGGMRSFCSLRCTIATAAEDCPVPPTSGECNMQGFCK